MAITRRASRLSDEEYVNLMLGCPDVPPRETMTAYHEAGHVVAAGYNGVELGSIVTIVPDLQRNFLGYTQTLYTRMSIDLGARRQEVLGRMTMMLAGEAAESWITPETLNGQRTDEQDARRLAAEVFGPRAVPAIMGWARRRARALVVALWPAIEAVALGLLAHKTLRVEDAFRLALVRFTDEQLVVAAKGRALPGADLAALRHWREHPVELKPAG